MSVEVSGRTSTRRDATSAWLAQEKLLADINYGFYPINSTYLYGLTATGNSGAWFYRDL